MIKMNFFLYGIAGFCIFEVLRVFKNTQIAGKSLSSVIVGGPVFYILLIVSVAFVSGFVALQFSGDDINRSIYIGFTLPTSATAIFTKPEKENQVSVEDITFVEYTFRQRIFTSLKKYFAM
jgi:hypothetical protein